MLLMAILLKCSDGPPIFLIKSLQTNITMVVYTTLVVYYILQGGKSFYLCCKEYHKETFSINCHCVNMMCVFYNFDDMDARFITE